MDASLAQTSCRFNLINLRQSFGFKLIKNGFQRPVIAASSAAPITNDIPDRPMGGHLTVVQDGSNAVAVQWISARGGTQQVRVLP